MIGTGTGVHRYPGPEPLPGYPVNTQVAGNIYCVDLQYVMLISFVFHAIIAISCLFLYKTVVQ